VAGGEEGQEPVPFVRQAQNAEVEIPERAGAAGGALRGVLPEAGADDQTAIRQANRMKMKSRSAFPPQGWWYYQPETNWPEVPQAFFAGMTFDQAVDAIIKHRRANPRFNLATDAATVGDQLDAFTAMRLAGNAKARDYLIEGDPEKKAGAPSYPWAEQRRGSVADGVKKVAAGAGALWDWLGDGGDPVLPAMAVSRAMVCAECERNKPGDWTSWFTVPASELIRKQLEIRNDMELKTPLDGRLGVCGTCLCPLPLTVWVPIEYKLKTMRQEVFDQLPEWCWVKKEKQT
jgi:hypothetical protein